MAKYILKRLAQSLLTIFLVVCVVFLLMRLLPNDYYFTEEQLIKLTDEQQHDILEKAGMLDHPLVQLGRYLKGILLHGDFGVSHRIQTGKSVTSIIASRFGISMRLGLIALVFSLLIGVPSGILQARFKDGLYDHIGTAFTIFINAVPHLVSYSLVMVFGARLLGLPSMYSGRKVWKFMLFGMQCKFNYSQILPIICLSLGGIASNAMWMRRYMVDQLNMDYIRLARAKGMTSGQVAFRHIFRNALVPMVQSLPASLLFTISGSLYVESLFSINGMGGLLITSIQRQDNPLVQAMVLLYSVISVLGLLLGDLAMMLVDPRITFTKKGGSR